MSTTEFVRRLPSTAETDLGPIIEHKPGVVTIRYDRERGEGVLWVTIRFLAAAAFRLTPDPACTEIMVDAYSQVLVVEASPWLAELRAIARSAGGDLPASLKHFEVYFDHRGCVEVLAEAVEVDGEDVQ